MELITTVRYKESSSSKPLVTMSDHPLDQPPSQKRVIKTVSAPTGISSFGMEWIAKKGSQVLHKTNKTAHNLVTMSDLPPPSKKRHKAMPAPTGISVLLAECVEHRLGDVISWRIEIRV